MSACHHSRGAWLCQNHVLGYDPHFCPRKQGAPAMFDSWSSCPNCSWLIICVCLPPSILEVILTGAPLTHPSYRPHTRQIPQRKRSCCTSLTISSSSTLTSAPTASRSSSTQSTSVAWRYEVVWGWAIAQGALSFHSVECWGRTAALPALLSDQREWEPICCAHST